MCGIVGGIGQFPIRDYLINGLKTLDYRGYDSAGVALAEPEGIHVFRMPGRVQALDEATPRDLHVVVVLREHLVVRDVNERVLEERHDAK